MRELPASWEWSTVGEIATVQLGRQRSPKNHSGPHMRPYLRSANVTWRGIDVADVKQMNFAPDEAATFELQDGDLLLNEASGSPGEVGKPAIWRNEIPGACFQNTLLRVRSAEMDEGFLYWYFHNAAFTGRFGEAGRGVNIRHLGKRGLASFPVPVPPVLEQQRIVRAVEEHLSRLDAAEAGLDDALKRVRFCQDAVAGRLLEKVGEQIELADALDHFSDCPHRTPTYTDDGEFVALRPRDVVDGVLRLESAARVDRREFDIQSERRRLDRGDVVYSRELSYGWAAVIPERDRACLSQGMVAMVPGVDLLPEFLVLVLNSPTGRRQSARAATGSAHPHVNLRDIRKFQIPMPALDEQRRIVAQAAEARSALARLQSDVEVQRRRSAALRRSALAAAFSGRLLPQDSSDEPASALLERIAAEWAATKPSRRKKAAS